MKRIKLTEIILLIAKKKASVIAVTMINLMYLMNKIKYTKTYFFIN